MSKRRMTHTNANGATGDADGRVSVEIECKFLIIRGHGCMDVRVQYVEHDLTMEDISIIT